MAVIEPPRNATRAVPPCSKRFKAFANPPRGYDTKGAHWVTSALVAEISFIEWTTDGTLRHPSFQGLREDKKAKDVKRERPA